MSVLEGLIHLLLYGKRMPRDVRPYFRDEHEVDLDGRTYCVYTELQARGVTYAIGRRSIRDVTGGTCKDGGAPVTPDVAAAVLAKLEAHFRRVGIRYEIV